MKKRILSAVLLVCMVLCVLASCGQVGEAGDVTVVIENRDGEYKVYKTYLENVENKKNGAVGVIENLMAREENPISADIVSSTYGAYVNSIGDIVPDSSKNEYVGVYTSCEADFSTYEGVNTIYYEDVTLKTSGVGLSFMKVEAGTVILFRIETY